MNTISDRLFLTLSAIIGIRVTKDNFRSKIKLLQKDGMYNQKMKNEMIGELVFAIVELDEEIQNLKDKKKE
jgi:hypothetical protein